MSVSEQDAPSTFQTTNSSPLSSSCFCCASMSTIMSQQPTNVTVLSTQYQCVMAESVSMQIMNVHFLNNTKKTDNLQQQIVKYTVFSSSHLAMQLLATRVFNCSLDSWSCSETLGTKSAVLSHTKVYVNNC